MNPTRDELDISRVLKPSSKDNQPKKLINIGCQTDDGAKRDENFYENLDRTLKVLGKF